MADSKVSKFVTATGADNETAHIFLQATGEDLDTAVRAFFHANSQLPQTDAANSTESTQSPAISSTVLYSSGHFSPPEQVGRNDSSAVVGKASQITPNHYPSEVIHQKTEPSRSPVGVAEEPRSVMADREPSESIHAPNVHSVSGAPPQHSAHKDKKNFDEKSFGADNRILVGNKKRDFEQIRQSMSDNAAVQFPKDNMPIPPHAPPSDLNAMHETRQGFDEISAVTDENDTVRNDAEQLSKFISIAGNGENPDIPDFFLNPAEDGDAEFDVMMDADVVLPEASNRNVLVDSNQPAPSLNLAPLNPVDSGTPQLPLPRISALNNPPTTSLSSMHPYESEDDGFFGSFNLEPVHEFSKALSQGTAALNVSKLAAEVSDRLYPGGVKLEPGLQGLDALHTSVTPHYGQASGPYSMHITSSELSNPHLYRVNLPPAGEKSSNLGAHASYSNFPYGPRRQFKSMSEDDVEEVFDFFGCGSGKAWWENLPKAERPALLRESVSLYPHQSKAITWMIRMESKRTVATLLAEKKEEMKLLPESKRKKPSVYFWQESTDLAGQTAWYNTVKHASVTTDPELPRGGLLADDMGLGKTLTTLSCIAADWPNIVNRPSAEGKRTLLIVPLALIDSWRTQALHFLRVDSPLRHMCVYHGSRRENALRDSHDASIVVTTYNTLSSEYGQLLLGKPSPLYSTSWRRIVLDEAHTIKNRRTKMAQACWELNAEIHWALTGTPLQNKIDDMYPLVKFIGVYPFDDYKTFKHVIAAPLERGNDRAFGTVQTLLSSITLRRLKTDKLSDGSPIVKLPKRTEQVIAIELSRTERELYDRLEDIARRRVRRLMKQGEAMQNYMLIIEMVLRLRQLALDAPLVPDNVIKQVVQVGEDPQTDILAFNVVDKSQLLAKLDKLIEDMPECTICFEFLGRPNPNEPEKEKNVGKMLPCSHAFCKSCIDKVVQSDFLANCPTCRKPFRLMDVVTASEERPMQFEFEVKKEEEETKLETSVSIVDESCDDISLSSKTRRLLRYLRDMPKDDKVVVFSQFTSYLSRLGETLKVEQIEYTKIAGSMTTRDRVRALHEFEHGRANILLASLKAAGFGLNLAFANHVVLMDTWWNPAVEEQAIDRVYRLGQRKAVSVVRIIGKNTIEQRMLDRHEDKRLMAQGALTRKSKTSSKKASERARREKLKRVTDLLGVELSKTPAPESSNLYKNVDDSSEYEDDAMDLDSEDEDNTGGDEKTVSMNESGQIMANGGNRWQFEPHGDGQEAIAMEIS